MYIDKLYDSVTSLYKLDQIGEFEGKLRLGEMPLVSVALLGGIGLTWVGILTYVGVSYFKKQKN